MARLDPAPSIDGAEEEPVDRPSHRPFRRRAQSLVHRAPSGLGARILLDQAAGAMDEAFARIKGLPLGERGAQLHRIVERGRASQRLLKESTVAIVGPVNAGKSTLFNVLVGADAASVSSEAGTTRDALLERAHIGPWPVRFLDTAGERDLTGLAASGDRSAQVEQAGQRIAQDLASRADLVLRLVPFDGAFQPREASSQEVLLGTQAAVDLGPMPDAWPPFTLSAKEAPDHARDVVQAAFESALGLRGLGELWIPGEAVPFDSQSLGMLADVAKLPEVDDRTLDSALEHL